MRVAWLTALAIVACLACGGGIADTKRVLPPEGQRIDVQALRQEVHVGLDGKGRLGDAKAPECACWWVVGVHGVAVDLGMGNIVGTGRLFNLHKGAQFNHFVFVIAHIEPEKIVSLRPRILFCITHIVIQ